MDHADPQTQPALRVVAGGGQGATWVVIDKPAGLLSTPGKHALTDPRVADCVAARVQSMFPSATGPLIAHRLDMDTSGLMVLGLTPAAQRYLSMQFEQRTIAKRYTAIVEGRSLNPGDTGIIVLPMRLDIDHRPRQIVDMAFGKFALTRYACIAHEPLGTRLVLQPVTGRSHQLRVHAAHPLGLRAPIVGDVLYGTPGPRLMLHAQTLCFASPDTGAHINVRSEPPF